MVDQSSCENTTIRTTIKPELMRTTLRRGGWLAAIGAAILVLGGSLLPLVYLKIWGIPLFLAGLTSIAIGWLPYRRLQRLALKPHSLEYDGTYFFFVKDGKPLFKIPEVSIAKLEYAEKEHMYGLTIWLKKPVEEKVGVLQAHFDFEGFAGDSASRFQGCDLFLPYFSERSFKHLLESSRAS